MSTIQMLIITSLSELMIMLLRRKKYQFSILDMLYIYLVVLAFGFLGAFVASWLETGHFGIKYYGTVLCVVLALFPLSKLIKKPYEHIMNYVVVQGALGIVIMKFNCIIHSCCSGKIIILDNGISFVFPSQWFEFITVTIIFATLLVMEIFSMSRKYLFPIFMISYGGTRFLFDMFRANQGKEISFFGWQIFWGEICSLIITLIGVMYLFIILKKASKNTLSAKNDICE